MKVWLHVLLAVFWGAALHRAEYSSAADPRPILRLDADGPMSFGRALAFDEDGVLFAGGWDQLVRAWRHDAQGFARDRTRTLRVPLGPGLDGAINAMAISPNGRFLAVAGVGVARDTAGFDTPGRIVPSVGGMTEAMRKDQGVILLWDKQTGNVTRLRGHRGEVLALAFATPSNRSLLVSAGVARHPADRDGQGVVRVWDAEDGGYVRGAYLNVDPARVTDPPQLAAMRTPQGELEVAIAWNDGQLRFWTEAGMRKFSAGAPQTTKTAVAIGGALVTGGYEPQRGGGLQSWRRSGASWAADGAAIPLRPISGRLGIPQAICVLPGPRKQLAVAVQTFAVQGRQTVPDQLELHVIDWVSRTALQRIPLWKSAAGNVDVPGIVASPDGRWIAASGGAPSHGIHVFPRERVQQGQDTREILRSHAGYFDEASFVTREDALGIRVRLASSHRRGGEASQEYVFDPRGRDFVAPDGWQPVVASERATVTPVRQAERLVLRIQTASGTQTDIRLPASQEGITSWAYTEASPLDGRPMLAVASQEKGMPWLGLFDVETGQQLRQFTGHTEIIRTLAFGPQGRLLVSTSPDHTLRVWNLSDLDETWRRHGMLEDVRVVQRADKLVVDDVGTKASGTWRVGDVVSAVRSDGQPITWASGAEFYAAWWDLQPNQMVTVEVERAGEQKRLPVRVGQGIDERKPLWSLFAARQEGDAPRQWVGWSPLGLFESSDPGVERFLGWHFNTPEESAPTRYAPLSEYRADFFRSGLLAHLLDHGVPPVSVPREPPPSPDLALVIRQGDESVLPAGGLAVLSDIGPADLELTVDSLFPRELIERVECFGDGDTLARPEEWSSGQFRWPLAVERLAQQALAYEVAVTTRENPPRTFRRRLQLQYRPAPPQVVVDAQASTIMKSDTLTVSANISSPVDASVEVELFHETDDRRERIGRWTMAELNGKLEQQIPLSPGRHQFDVVARNQGDAADDQETLRSLIVHRRADTPAEQQLDLGLRAADTELERIGGQRLSVTTPEITIAGSAAGNRPLESVRMRWESPNGQQEEVDVPWGKESGSILHVLPRLPRGKSRVWIEATDVAGAVATRHFSVDYQPTAPQVAISQPAANDELWLSAAEPQKVPFVASLLLPENEAARAEVADVMTARLRVNGVEQPAELRVDRDRGQLLGTVELAPGQNALEVDVSVAEQTTTDRVDVACFARWVAEVQVSQQQSVTVPVPTALEPTGVIDARTGADLPWRRDEQGRVEIVPDPQLATAGYVARVQLGRLPATDVTVPPQPTAQRSQSPQINFSLPELDEQTQRPTAELAFEIASPSVLNHVELWQTSRDGRRRIELGNGDLQKSDRGVRRSHRERVDLVPGLNTFAVFAANQDGATSQSRHLTFIEPPAVIRVARLTSIEGGEIGNSAERGAARFREAAPQATMVLHGSVSILNDQRERWQSGRHYVHVWVNGFQQLPARLTWDAAEESRLRFSAPVLLGQSVNEVHLHVPGVPGDLEHQSFLLRCAAPLADQRLHLLVIGVEEQSDAQQLLRGALNALRLRPFGVGERNLDASRRVHRLVTKPDGSGKRHVFREVFVYRPLIGKAASNRMISGHLGIVHRTIVDLNARRGRAQAPASDVVVVYYAGTEQVRNDGFFHLATAAKNQFLRSDLLSRFVQNTLGAHLLLLDVHRTVGKGGPLPQDAGISVLRLAQPEAQPRMTQLLADAESVRLEQFNQELDARVRRAPGYPQAIQYDGVVAGSMRQLQLAPE